MSYLGGFMDGLGDAQQRNERSARLQMDLETRRAALSRDALADARADERLTLDKNRDARDAKAAEFDLRQKTDAADRDRRYMEALQQWGRTYLAPQEEPGPDGQIVRKPPRQSTLAGQIEMYRDKARIDAEFGVLKPEMLKQLSDYGQQARRQGFTEALFKAKTGDNSGLMEVAKSLGANPQSVRVETVVDPKTKLASTRVRGVGSDGKPFDEDMTPLMMAAGLEGDIDAVANNRALTGARIDQAQSASDLARTRAANDTTRARAYSATQGARAAALRGEGGAGGAGGRVDFSEKEAKDFNAIVNRTAPKVSIMGREVEDADGREVLRSIGKTYFADTVREGKPRPSTVQTIEYAQNALRAANGKAEQILQSRKFTRDPQTGRAVPATDPAAPGMPFKSLPEQERLRLLTEVRRQVLDDARRRYEEGRARAQQAVRQRALNTGGSEEDEE